MKGLWKRLVTWLTTSDEVVEPVAQERRGISQAAIQRAKGLGASTDLFTPRYPIKPPFIPVGVVPTGESAPVLAMDAGPLNGAFNYLYGYGDIAGFPGFPYLSTLATRSEYRAFASSLSTEMTREWITLNSSETAGDETKKKITEISKKLQEMKIQQLIQLACEHDSYFGRGQIYIGIKGNDDMLPLVLNEKTVRKGADLEFKVIEPIWTTPATYNAIDPTKPDFYKPLRWFVMGKQIHASRLLTVVTRPVPDMLKPAFNFAGMSLSQLAEPYVNNWLRTRQSVSDIINAYSLTILSTDMGQVLQGSDDGVNLFNRLDFFTATRSNRGVMIIDKDREDMVQINTPLAGLDELQAQAQEHMCSPAHMPSIVLTGIDPSGLNASSEGAIKCWENWVMANLEAFYRAPLEIIIQLIQLIMYGNIDKDISFTFNPLSQMTPKELAEIRKSNADVAAALIDRSVLDPSEERERIARDPESGYQGLDLTQEVVDVNPEGDEDESDA